VVHARTYQRNVIIPMPTPSHDTIVPIGSCPKTHTSANGVACRSRARNTIMNLTNTSESLRLVSKPLHEFSWVLFKIQNKHATMKRGVVLSHGNPWKRRNAAPCPHMSGCCGLL
jgi:hypothetical protein